MNERLTMSVAEVARKLGICEKSAYTLTHRADFPVIRLGRRVRVSREGLRAWVQKQAQTGAEVSA